MPGNRSRPTFVLQPRDQHLLTELSVLRVIDREQSRVVAGFHSITRANTRLLTLTRAGYLRHVAVGTTSGGHKYLYSLTRRGAAAVDCAYRPVPLKPHAVIAGQPFLEHQLRLNAVYLGLKYCECPIGGLALRRWQTFTTTLTPTLRLIPDAYVELTTAEGIKAMFLEIDQGTESLRVWRGKVDQYLTLAVSGAFAQIFQHPQFRVLVIVPSMKRLHTLRRHIASLTTKIFWLTTAETASGPDLFGPVWYRPLDDQPRPLI